MLLDRSMDLRQVYDTTAKDRQRRFLTGVCDTDLDLVKFSLLINLQELVVVDCLFHHLGLARAPARLIVTHIVRFSGLNTRLRLTSSFAHVCNLCVGLLVHVAV